VRYVNLIRSLDIIEVPMVNSEEVQYQPLESMHAVGIDEFLLDTTATVKHKPLPIHKISKICHGQKVDTFIAYSREVQDLLELPFDLLKKENEMLTISNSKLERELSNIKELPFLGRLKFLFTSS
jgi:hypothetical protein